MSPQSEEGRSARHETSRRWLDNGLRRSAVSYADKLGLKLEAGHSISMARRHYLRCDVRLADAEAWFDLTPELVESRQPELKLIGDEIESRKDRELEANVHRSH